VPKLHFLLPYLLQQSYVVLGALEFFNVEVYPDSAVDLEEPVRLEMTAQLNQLLADTMTLRDLYKKSHWQVRGTDVLPTASALR